MFSDNLKKIRKEHGLSQAQLAKELGLGVSTIGMYESNIRKPSYDVLKKMSDYFNVPIDFLINDGNTKDNIAIEYYISQIEKLAEKEQQQILDFIEFVFKNHKDDKNT